MKYLVLAPVFTVFVGCAAQPEQQVSDAAARRCEPVYVVGSHMPTRDCAPRSSEQSEADRQRMIDALREGTKPRAQPSAAGG